MQLDRSLGAVWVPGGACNFLLWAPKAETVEVHIPQWSGQKRPCVVTSKPAIWNGPGRSPYLSCFLLIRQVCFGSPASRSAFKDMPVVKQTIQHGGDRGTVAEQFAPVFHRAVGSE